MASPAVPAASADAAVTVWVTGGLAGVAAAVGVGVGVGPDGVANDGVAAGVAGVANGMGRFGAVAPVGTDGNGPCPRRDRCSDSVVPSAENRSLALGGGAAVAAASPVWASVDGSGRFGVAAGEGGIGGRLARLGTVVIEGIEGVEGIDGIGGIDGIEGARDAAVDMAAAVGRLGIEGIPVSLASAIEAVSSESSGPRWTVGRVIGARPRAALRLTVTGPVPSRPETPAGSG